MFGLASSVALYIFWVLVLSRQPWAWLETFESPRLGTLTCLGFGGVMGVALSIAYALLPAWQSGINRLSALDVFCLGLIVFLAMTIAAIILRPKGRKI